MAQSELAGLDRCRLLHLKSVMEEDIRRQLYFGAVVIVARHGHIGLFEALGHADENRMRPVHPDSVFNLFSLSKAFTNVLALRAIEQGQLALTTPVAQVIPEFAGRGRDAITLFHLLTASSGMPGMYTPRTGMYIDRLSEVIGAICRLIQPAESPGTHVEDSPMINHALMGEMVRRTDPARRGFREILQQDVLEPLGMRDTSVGLRADLRARHLLPEFRGNVPAEHLGHSNLGPQGAFLEEQAEMPWAGVIGTAADLFRFAEMLRRGGELEGARILGPAILNRARQCCTGARPNETYRRIAEARGWRVIPAYLGLGFQLRGDELGHTVFGTLTSPGTFGNCSSGTCLYWVDPALDMSFIGLCTGVMTAADNTDRWQRLSDIVVSAAL